MEIEGLRGDAGAFARVGADIGAAVEAGLSTRTRADVRASVSGYKAKGKGVAKGGELLFVLKMLHYCLST